ncbi:hypothetical protein WN943_029673 [Citrus x changshan-huyou]|uniref:RING-type domain-containing protein n=1 Tax=Citrus sinensis TaxID=2711 RepID=A0ACB8I117_CITSI|nr:RING-type domain-containing protein [Citrus sinensis]
MSTWELGQCLGRNARDGQRRRILPELDLNYPPTDGNIATNSQEYPFDGHSDSRGDIGDCVEVIDDDLAIINQRIFAEAKNNSRRNHSQVVDQLRHVLTDAGGLLDSLQEVTDLAILYVKQRRSRPDEATPDNCCINVDTSNNNKNDAAPLQLPQDPMAAAPTFSCPICMGPLSEATSTKCGHIFCKDCIKGAIAAQGKCPNCRQKVGKRGIFRVYLPTLS